METSITGEDMWTPFKELCGIIEVSIFSSDLSVIDELEKTLRKYKQSFLTILKNPPKNAKSREDLLKGMKEGIRLPSIGHQTLPKDLVDEAIILSDMYNLNEYIALQLLCSAQEQMANYPGLTRGLVAVLLYYDGRKALVTSLRILVQARKGILWVVGGNSQIINYITNYTNELMEAGLIPNILNTLESLDLYKEMEILQKNRALGGPKHHQLITDFYQNIRQGLADIVYLWAAQTGLPKDSTIELLKLLQKTSIQEDSSGGIDNVTLALQMAFLYAIDISILHRVENGDDAAENLPLLSQSEFIPQLLKEITPNCDWKCKGLQGLTLWSWAITLASLRFAPASLQCYGSFPNDENLLVNAAMELNVFNFLINCVLTNNNIYKEEFYVRRIHTVFSDFIILLPLKINELRNKADEANTTITANLQQGLQPPSNVSRHFEHMLLALAKLYHVDPLNLNLELDYWCPVDSVLPSSYLSRPRQVSLFKFIRQSGDILPANLFVPYMKLLASIMSCEAGAKQGFRLLKQNHQSSVSWDHFFDSLNRYYNHLRQELPPMSDTVYRQRSYSKGITPHEIQGLQAVLNVVRTVAEYDEVSRLALCENPAWAPLSLLLGLVTCSVQISLKAELLMTLAALAKSPETAAILWHNLEASQILVTVPSTSSYQPRGIQTELEELESRNEEYPLTRAMLHLLDVLTDKPIPRLLGTANRTPGFDPYLFYILDSVLLKFNSRSYKNIQEKWEVGHGCLRLLVKFLNQYEPHPDNFNKSTNVCPPPGYHVMVQLCSKSELLRLVLKLIEEGCQLLDTYTVFSGKAVLETTTLLCLELLESALSLQQRFLTMLMARNSDLLLIGVDKLLNGINSQTGKPDHLLNITKYVTYNCWLPAHTLSAINILRFVTLNPVNHSHLVPLLTSTSSLSLFIRHGFVECLDADNDEETSEGDKSLSLVSRTKEAICKLLLQCLNHATPNISQYLFGFDLNKNIKKTVFQQPGVLGFPRTCLHSILTILNTSLQLRQSKAKLTTNHRLLELGYQIVYALTSNIYTSEPTLRFLRSTGDFLQRHILGLPFKSSNQVSDLIQTSWLLKAVAVELKVTSTNYQLSQLTTLIRLLVSTNNSEDEVVDEDNITQVFSSQLSHGFSCESVTESSQNKLIYVLLKDIPFYIEPVPQPGWEFFVPSQIEQVLNDCESHSSAGIKVIDIKRLHRILMDELLALQGSSTANQRAHILQEIQKVLTYAVQHNRQRKKASASVQYLDAWRQTVQIMFAVIPKDCLSFHLKFSLLLDLIYELLSKVLAHSVLKDISLLTSDAVLLLFVNLRNCFTLEYRRISSKREAVTETSQLAINVFTSLLRSKENMLTNIMAAILRWILSSMPSQKLRSNLYASLLNFLHLSRQQNKHVSDVEQSLNSNSYVSLLDDKKSILQPVWVSKHSSLQVLTGFGERLVTVLCHDCAGGHDICKMLALSCLNLMVELDPNWLWVSFLSARGYLKFLVNSLLDSDAQLIEVLSPMLKSLRPLYVHESKMALLCTIASTQMGAELLLEQNCMSCLSSMQVFDNHPDILPTISGQDELMQYDFAPCVSSRYFQIMSPTLSLCETILSSLGVENESAVSQVLHFILSHGDSVSQVLRSGSPFLKLSYLKELAQLSGVIARATNQKIIKKINEEYEESGFLLESTSHFHRIQKQMLFLLSRFIISESLFKEVFNTTDFEINKPENKSEIITNILQIAANILFYIRNLVSSGNLHKRISNVILQPLLLDPISLDRREITTAKEASIGLIVRQLIESVNYYHREKLTLNLLIHKYSTIPDMNPTTIKEILPGNFNNLCVLDEYKEIATKKVKHDIDNKKQEIYLSSFIIENCMFLLWTHLDYYMLRAIPNKTLGVDSSLVFGRSSQMAEITWNATVEEINVLKQGLVFAFNDTFCKNLIATTQDQKAINKGYVEALLRRIKKLIQFVPSK